MGILIIILPVFILLLIIMVIYDSKCREKRNRVHFYVARDKDRELYLYLGKPLRDYGEFIGDLTKGSIVLTGYHFNKFGLNTDDFKNLKWEDEPVEVFINMED